MPEFEEILKLLVMFGGFMGIIIASGIGFKILGRKPNADPELADRLNEAESRIGELEERLDFSERALADIRARDQVKPGPE